MLSRSLLRAALDVRSTSSTQLPPTFLLPWRAHLHQATTGTQFQATPPEIPPQSPSTPVSPPRKPSIKVSRAPKPRQPPPTTTSSSTPPPPPTSIAIPETNPLVLSSSTHALLPHLHAQRPHYITTHIHSFPYLLTEGDTVRLPFHMPLVRPGDILRLNRASVLGSRDFTLKASVNPASEGRQSVSKAGYIDDRLFECRVRVMAVDSEPMRVKEKTKRRNRKTRTAKSKHKYTVLKVMQVRVKSLEELMLGEKVILLGKDAEAAAVEVAA